jgi:hypothetical protein
VDGVKDAERGPGFGNGSFAGHLETETGRSYILTLLGYCGSCAPVSCDWIFIAGSFPDPERPRSGRNAGLRIEDRELRIAGQGAQSIHR